MARPRKEEVKPIQLTGFLLWPMVDADIPQTPRLFRCHRIDGFQWQAYVVDQGIEYPIGKPDLFDIIKNRINGCMRAEGQIEFIAAKLKGEAKLA